MGSIRTGHVIMDRAWNTFTHGYSILFTVLYAVNKISTERLDSRFLRSVLKGKITPISIGCCSFFRGVVYCDRNPKNAAFKLYASFFFSPHETVLSFVQRNSLFYLQVSYPLCFYHLLSIVSSNLKKLRIPLSSVVENV